MTSPEPTPPKTQALRACDSPTPKRRRLTLYALTAAAVLIACLIFILSLRSPTPPASGLALLPPPNSNPSTGHNTSPSTPPTILRLATFNIHRGVGTDGRLDLPRIAQLLRDSHVAGLNEIDGRPRLRGGNDQAHQLALLLHRHHLFAPTERRWGVEHFGNAALSTLPASAWSREPLPCSRNAGYRNLLTLRLDWPSPDKPLTLLITHLDRTDGHLQRPIVLRRFADAPPPAALLGDFNATRSELADFFSLPHVTEALDAAATEAPDADAPPQTRIDWLFTKGLRISRAQLVNTTASDHPLLWADVELP